LGVILYEMLAGALPFTADTPVAVLLKHISDKPPSVCRHMPDLPQEIDQVLERALDKRPEDRYPTGAALAQALAQAWALDMGGEG
jgi:serine/threonine-protein kinase